MIFNFLRSAFGPDAGRNAMRASYEKHYQLAISNGIEPITSALYGALGSRYKIRGRFISETIHMVEICPFAMMDQHEGKERLADYVLAQEIPDQISADETCTAVNNAFREQTGANANDAYALVVSSLPLLKGSGILWFRWLDRDVTEQLRKDAERGQSTQSN